LTTETSLEVVRVGKAFGGDALVSTDPHGLGTLLYDRISDDNTPLKKYLRWSESLHGVEIGRRGVAHVESLENILADHEIVHISFSGNCSSMRELESTLNDEFQGNVTILATIYPSLDFTLLDILPPDASKGHGVSRLAELNGLTAANVMCIGDNFNDLEMLEYAGTPVVMGNAAQDLLDRRDFHSTFTNDQAGVAAAIEQFILNP